jgi:hypothetical protein
VLARRLQLTRPNSRARVDSFGRRRLLKQTFIFGVLTEARAACKKAFVEIFIINRHGFDEGGAHADHSLAHPGPATETKRRYKSVRITIKHASLLPLYRAGMQHREVGRRWPTFDCKRKIKSIYLFDVHKRSQFIAS